MITLHPARLTVETDRGSVKVRPAQARILMALASRPNRVVSYGTITDFVWPHDADEPSCPRDVIKVNVCTLRQRLRPIAGADLIRTQPHVGYMLTAHLQIGEPAA